MLKAIRITLVQNAESSSSFQFFNFSSFCSSFFVSYRTLDHPSVVTIAVKMMGCLQLETAATSSLGAIVQQAVILRNLDIDVLKTFSTLEKGVCQLQVSDN